MMENSLHTYFPTSQSGRALGKLFVYTIVNRLRVNFLGFSNCFMSISISRIKDHYISVYQAIYDTSNTAKHLDIATVNKITKFYETTFPSEIIFPKKCVSTSDEKVVNLTKKFNIHYRDCIGSLINLLSTRVYLIFTVHNFDFFSSNTDKVHLVGLVPLLRYFRENKSLCLKYYDDLKYARLSDLLIQYNIKTNNQLMVYMI